MVLKSRKKYFVLLIIGGLLLSVVAGVKYFSCKTQACVDGEAFKSNYQTVAVRWKLLPHKKAFLEGMQMQPVSGSPSNGEEISSAEKYSALKEENRNQDSCLPIRYSYKEINRLPTIRNQENLNTCWAFASLAALQSSIMPQEENGFSVDNMVYNGGYTNLSADGGDYTRAIAYLTSWKGPVYEQDDIYNDGICNKETKAVKHVQEVQILENKDLQAVKQAVFATGGVESSLYCAINVNTEESDYYNCENYAYYYNGTFKPNHDVVIVGWDDEYAKENFNIEPEANGAFICMNSWGTNFGEQGLFYVSYYDANLAMHSVVYTKVEAPDNYDAVYQSDLCGWVGQIGYDMEKAYFANVYTAEADENIAAVGFYATGKSTTYDIYLVENFTGKDSFQRKKYIQSGTIRNTGYYTIKLEEPIQMASGCHYAVVVYIKTPGAVHPVAIEYCVGEATKDVDLSDGEGYISLSGKNWEHVEDTKNCNICLKVYTKRE